MKKTKEPEQGKARPVGLPEPVVHAADLVAKRAYMVMETLWNDVEPSDNPELCVARDCEFLSRLPSVLGTWRQVMPQLYASAETTVREYAEAIREVGPSAGLGEDEIEELAGALDCLAEELN